MLVDLLRKLKVSSLTRYSQGAGEHTPQLPVASGSDPKSLEDAVLYNEQTIGSNFLIELYVRFKHEVAERGRIRGYEIMSSSHHFDVVNGDKVIRVAVKHFIYLDDIIAHFDYYFDCVEPVHYGSKHLVDYSVPKYHDVIGYDRSPVFFTSFCEPLKTTGQYLDFAKLNEGDRVFDLGAYSGLTSILFRDAVGDEGRVLAVEPDTDNLFALRKNLALYRAITRRDIKLVEGAVWHHNDGISFSSEGNMGSGANEILGYNRGKNIEVQSYTLSNLAEASGFDRVDFIKCDIEGAERYVFDDQPFFLRHKPKIIIETHGEGTPDHCASVLARYGYRCRIIEQAGVYLPLMECSVE
jgi:FkbM family methyltransferase